MCVSGSGSRVSILSGVLRFVSGCQLGSAVEPAGCQQLSRGEREEREEREGGKVNKPIKDALSQAERRRGEGGSGQTVPGLVGRLLAALQRDRELSGVLRERRGEEGSEEKGGVKGDRERRCGGAAQQCWICRPASRARREGEKDLDSAANGMQSAADTAAQDRGGEAAPNLGTIHCRGQRGRHT